MKVSIVTVCYNNESTIAYTIDSVLNQSYNNIEYIIIDGYSLDQTKKIIASYGDRVDHFISEPDKGIYNAMNKGIKIATGDIIGILNADDFFTNEKIIEKIVEEFESNNLDAVYGDVQFVKPDKINKVVRYYSSKKFNLNKFKYGIMPAHPSFYVKSEAFKKYGYYKEDYRIASDFEILIRFLYTFKMAHSYVEFPFVTMRTGGISNKSLKSRFILNKEILRACRENGIKTNLLYIYSKYFKKLLEFIGNN